MAHVALYAGDEAIWKRAIDAPFGIRNQLRQGVTGDYLWYEQSLGYNSYVVKALYPLFEFAARLGRLEELRPEAEIIENMALAPLALRFPDNRLPTPADGHPTRVDLGFLASVVGVFPTVAGQQEAARQRDWDTLLDFPTVSTASKAPLPPVESVPRIEPHGNLEARRLAGLFSLRAIASIARAVRSAQFRSDFRRNRFDARSRNRRIRLAAASRILHARSGSQRPLLDGEAQKGWNPGKLLAFDAASGRIEAAQPTYADKASARRALQIENNILRDDVWLDDVWLDEVWLDAGKDAAPITKLGLSLHLEGTLSLPDTFVPDADFAKNRPEAFGHWKSPRTASFQNEASFEVVIGERRLRVTLRTPGTFRLTHADAPSEPPRRHQGFYLETTGRAAQFTTIFEPLS